MRVIFIDFDGVVNNMWSLREKIDVHCAKLLYNLVHATDAKLVCSSTWRLGGKEKVQQDFAKFGFTDFMDFFHEDWATKRFYGKLRGEEVREWLSRHPEVEKYLCIDDDSDFFLDQPLLQTDTFIGLTYHDVQIATMFFNGYDKKNAKDTLSYYTHLKERVDRNLKLIGENKWII